PLEQGGLRKALLFLCFADGDRLGPAARAFLGELRYQTMSLPSVESIAE
ncbi:MAG: LysR family transcriptional regulator, partial [Pseudomonadota bacterium]|nr:LysR family transcriptional regulator [Pseudomonadota bacterium]